MYFFLFLILLCWAVVLGLYPGTVSCYRHLWPCFTFLLLSGITMIRDGRWSLSAVLFITFLDFQLCLRPLLSTADCWMSYVSDYSTSKTEISISIFSDLSFRSWCLYCPHFLKWLLIDIQTEWSQIVCSCWISRLQDQCIGTLRRLLLRESNTFEFTFWSQCIGWSRTQGMVHCCPRDSSPRHVVIPQFWLCSSGILRWLRYSAVLYSNFMVFSNLSVYFRWRCVDFRAVG